MSAPNSVERENMVPRDVQARFPRCVTRRADQAALTTDTLGRAWLALHPFHANGLAYLVTYREAGRMARTLAAIWWRGWRRSWRGVAEWE